MGGVHGNPTTGRTPPAYRFHDQDVATVNRTFNGLGRWNHPTEGMTNYVVAGANGHTRATVFLPHPRLLHGQLGVPENAAVQDVAEALHHFVTQNNIQNVVFAYCSGERTLLYQEFQRLST